MQPVSYTHLDVYKRQKKYHPIIVEKAKNNIQIAIKISPNFPYKVENANWLSSAPVFPDVLAPVVMITRAVRFRITNVSMNTPVSYTHLDVYKRQVLFLYLI